MKISIEIEFFNFWALRVGLFYTRRSGVAVVSCSGFYMGYQRLSAPSSPSQHLDRCASAVRVAGLPSEARRVREGSATGKGTAGIGQYKA